MLDGSTKNSDNDEDILPNFPKQYWDLKPKVIHDIVCTKLFEKPSGDLWIVGSKILDKFIVVPDNKIKYIHFVIERMDGVHTLRHIFKEALNEFQVKLHIEEIYDKLRSVNLVIDNQLSGKLNNSSEKSQIELYIPKKNKFVIDIVSLNIESFSKLKPILQKISRHTIIIKFCLYIPFVIIAAYLVYFFISAFFTDLGLSRPVFHLTTSSTTLLSSNLLGFLAFQMILPFAILAHEFSHVIAATINDVSPKRLKLSLYGFLWFTPLTDVPNLYLYPRAIRLKIWRAGILVNLWLVCSGLSTILMLYSFNIPHSEVIVEFIWKLCYANLVVGLMSSIPFLPMPSDGYFLLSTYFKIPNLRNKMKKTMKKILFHPITLDRKEFLLVVAALITTIISLFFISYQIYWIISLFVETYNFIPFNPFVKFIGASIYPMVIIFGIIRLIRQQIAESQEKTSYLSEEM